MLKLQSFGRGVASLGLVLAVVALIAGLASGAGRGPFFYLGLVAYAFFALWSFAVGARPYKVVS